MSKKHKVFKCPLCTKEQKHYYQKENFDKHIRVFHNGGTSNEDQKT